MKNLIILISCFVFGNSYAQVKKVRLQASGLTCSMCSNSINKAIQSLDYVKEVDANIKNSSFDITFNDASKVKFDQIKKKVEDAGFFVARFEVDYQFDRIAVYKDAHIESNDLLFHFLNVPEENISGEVTLRLLDKGFLSTKEFKKNSGLTKMECYKTGITAACCSKQNKAGGQRIYHVTIP